MKTIIHTIAKPIFALILFFSFFSVSAQSPNKMNYQAVVRNAANGLIANSNVGIQISILQTTIAGTAVFVERHTTTTNLNGLATIEIGGGTLVSGNFATINWANGPYFIKTQTDPTGGTNYTISGTSQLLSVPYALQAQKAEIANDVQGVQMFYYILTEGVFPSAGELHQFIGTIITHAGLLPLPVSDNYMPCNGQTLPILQHTSLFAILGTKYGGNGTTTFNLPNLNGKVIKGQ